MKVKCLVALLILALSTTVALADSKKSVKKASPKPPTQEVKVETSEAAAYKQIAEISKLIASQTRSHEETHGSFDKNNKLIPGTSEIWNVSETFSFWADPVSGSAEYKVTHYTKRQFSPDRYATSTLKFNLKFMDNKVIDSDRHSSDGVTGKPDNRLQVKMTCNDEYPCVEWRDICDTCTSKDETYHFADVNIAVSDETRNEITKRLVELINKVKEKQ